MKNASAVLRLPVALWTVSLVAFALSLSPVEHARAGGCASFRHYTSGFAARAGSALPANGGVLFVPTLADGAGEGNTFTRRGGDPLESLRRGTGTLASTRLELAPGWVILRPAEPTSGRITAVVGGSQRAFRMTRGDASALAPAHNPSLQYTAPEQQDTPIGLRMSSASNTLSLGRRPPAGAYAVVVRPVTPAGREPRGSGFAMRIEDPQQVSYWFSSDAGRCQPTRPGYVIGASADVDVFFVDLRGRVSAPVVTRVR